MPTHTAESQPRPKLPTEIHGALVDTLFSTVGSFLAGIAGAAIVPIVAYARTGSPLEALARLTPPPPTLHVYAIPKDDGFLAAQTAFAAKHPWFIVERLTSRTHFPTIDAPDALAEAVERFTVGRCAPSPPPRSSTT